MMKKISRKKFLQISSLGVASLAFATPFLGENLNIKKYHAIILGTSLEALVFAKEMEEKGFDNFLLLDLKKNEKNKENSYPILVKAHEKQTLEWLEKQQISYFETNKQGKTIGKYELEKSEKVELENAIFELQKMAKNLNWPQLKNDKTAQIYDKMLLAEWLENHLQTLAAHALFAYKIEEVFACQTDEISLLYFLHFLERNKGFDITNTDNQHFIVAEKKASVEAKIKKYFAQKIRFTQKIEFVDTSQNDFFIRTENENLTASQVFVAADFLKNENAKFATFATKKVIEKTSICIKISYKKAFWQDKNLNGQIISFSGLIKKTIDISLPHEKNANLLVFPDIDYFLSLEKTERKTLIIDELIDFLGEKALSYVQYQEYLNKKQVADISASFFDNNKNHFANENIFLLEKTPTMNI